MLQIYYGDGKGKTTAATGQLVRCAGAGKKACLARFMKGRKSSELNILSQLPQITVVGCDRDYGFFKNMSEKDLREIRDCHDGMLIKLAKMLENGEVFMLVLDEIFAALEYGLADETYVEKILTYRDSCELVMTGRNPAQRYIEAADYASCIEAVRHPYAKGVLARLGVEY